jgi:hypothetical protein
MDHGRERGAVMNDVTIPQYPWSEGDTVYASALNAAIANSGAGGPFLPLSGGTMTGRLQVNMPSASTAATFYSSASAANGVTIAPIGQYQTAPTSGIFSTLQAFTNVATTGGHASDAVTNAAYFNTTVYGAPNNFCWATSSVVNYNGTGGTGHNVALAAYGSRNTSAAQPTTTVAVTLSAPNNVVQVADVTNLQVPYPMPIAINGNPYMQTAVSGASGAGTITLSTNVPVADGTAGHTVQGNNNPQIWGANIYASDLTGLDSQGTNYSIGIELDLTCSGLDNAGTTLYGSPSGVRSLMTMIASLDTAHGRTSGEVGAALGIGTSGGPMTFKRVFSINAPFSQAVLDTRSATQNSGANAIWLAQGQTIAFDNAGANGASANVRVSGNGSVLSLTGSLTVSGQAGFNGTSPIAKPNVTGAKGSNAALASLMTALAAYGLVTDSTTA